MLLSFSPGRDVRRGRRRGEEEKDRTARTAKREGNILVEDDERKSSSDTRTT